MKLTRKQVWSAVLLGIELAALFLLLDSGEAIVLYQNF